MKFIPNTFIITELSHCADFSIFDSLCMYVLGREFQSTINPGAI